MASAIQLDIQKLYVAYFNRPADVDGLNYWEKVVVAANGNTAAVYSAFAASAEYKATFANMGAYTIVNQIYTNLFGRPAEKAGLDYWAEHLLHNRLSIDIIVKSVAEGAQSSDLNIFNNKVTVANAFTAALDTPAEVAAYAVPRVAPAASAFLSTVTTDASLATTLANIDALVLAVLQIPAGYDLSASRDDLTGTGPSDNAITGGLGNDVIVLGTTLSSSVTLAYANNEFGNDVVRNFVAGSGVGADKLSFTALGGTGAGFAGALVSNAHGAITVQAQSDANNTLSKIAALYTDGSVDAAHLFIAYDAGNVGKVYTVVDSASSAVKVTLVGSIDLSDTGWSTLVAANFA